MKRFNKKRYLILILLTGLLITANSCVTLRKNDIAVVKSFRKVNQTPKIYRVNFEGKSVRYISDKPFDKSLPTIIFVHGAPGSSDNFYKHLQDTTLQKKANLVSVDRLGYGYSDFGNAEVSIVKQAKMIDFIAQKYKQNKIILVGWSYGGPIIAKMTVENNNYAHLIMIAPAVSAKDEKHFWFGNVAKWKATKWMVPKVFVVAEDEKLAHEKELTKMESDWQKITTPITYYHGMNDGLVPYDNMAYLRTKVDPAILKYVTLDKGTHFIVFKEYDLIRKEMLDVLENL